MLGRIAAISFIFISTCVAWMILGGTITARTSKSRDSLNGRMESLWGGPHTQTQPTLSYTVESVDAKVTGDGKDPKRAKEDKVYTAFDIPMESSRIDVGLNLEHRQKGLLWYNTYKSDFKGKWTSTNPMERSENLRFTFNLPLKEATYDGLEFKINGAVVEPKPSADGFEVMHQSAAGEKLAFEVRYKSVGLREWKFSMGPGVKRAHDFQLVAHTNFADFDFPERTLAPSEKMADSNGGWDLKWNYSNLVSGSPIAIAMPEKLQPRPLSAEISFFAPVSLFFFFFLVWLLTTLRGIDIHPMHYFFMAAAFFAFHLLMAYLVDHISIHLAFGISAIVSMGLVISYLRQLGRVREAWREAALAQFVYLVLFSYAFFFNGYTGLSITVGAIVTLFAAMQCTAKLDWAQRFTLRPVPGQMGQQ